MSSLPWFRRVYQWACERLYNELAWAYDPVSRLVSLGRWPRWRQVALDYVAGRRVLEVGFGTGALLAEMASRGLEVYGLEPSVAMQRLTARKLCRLDVWVCRVRGRAQAMPFPDGFFDTIIVTFPAPFILDPATLRECARVLRAPERGAGTASGRLVIVGACVYARPLLLRGILPFVYTGSPDRLTLLCRRLEAETGFQVTVTTYRDSLVRLPVIVAELVNPQIP